MLFNFCLVKNHNRFEKVQAEENLNPKIMYTILDLLS